MAKEMATESWCNCCTICLPVGEEQYPEIVEDAEKFRAFLDDCHRQMPELFPADFSQGYEMKDCRTPKKLPVKLRRIQLRSARRTPFRPRLWFTRPISVWSAPGGDSLGTAADISLPPPPRRCVGSWWRGREELPSSRTADRSGPQEAGPTDDVLAVDGAWETEHRGPQKAQLVKPRIPPDYRSKKQPRRWAFPGQRLPDTGPTLRPGYTARFETKVM